MELIADHGRAYCNDSIDQDYNEHDLNKSFFLEFGNFLFWDCSIGIIIVFISELVHLMYS